MAASTTEEPKTMAVFREVGALSDLKNLFPTKVHFFIFVGYMALFISQGMLVELTPFASAFVIMSKSYVLAVILETYACKRVSPYYSPKHLLFT